MKWKLPVIVISVMIASILPDIILNECTPLPSDNLIPLKIFFFAALSLISLMFRKIKSLFPFFLILFVVMSTNVWTAFVAGQNFWKSNLVAPGFAGTYGSSVLLKLVGIIPIVLVLLLLFKRPKEFYLSKGDLSVKSDKIVWLGIRENTISWGKLSLISAFCIALGTILLVIVTVTRNLTIGSVSNWVKYIPLILVMAAVNSFCEGMIFRNAMLSALKEHLPKGQTILMAAIFFGSAHYYGAPGGILGMIMAGVLGWYMCRSMYETKGLATAWLIHFVQDVVIFSTLILTGR